VKINESLLRLLLEAVTDSGKMFQQGKYSENRLFPGKIKENIRIFISCSKKLDSGGLNTYKETTN
jgi:hypothetical protein